MQSAQSLLEKTYSIIILAYTVFIAFFDPFLETG